MTNNPKKNFIESAYDKVASTYATTANEWGHKDLLDRFVKFLNPNSHVLDAGCGIGLPVAKYLVEQKLEVVGIDISSAMIELAKANVPQATFIKGDIETYNFEAESFEGLVSCYTIIHIPREHHQKVFEQFASWLKPNGKLLVSIGNSDWEGTEDFLGTKMFWSHFAPEKTVTLIEQAGFRIRHAEPRMAKEESHFWVIAEKR